MNASIDFCRNLIEKKGVLKYFIKGLGEYFTLLNAVHKTLGYINTGIGLFTGYVSYPKIVTN